MDDHVYPNNDLPIVYLSPLGALEPLTTTSSTTYTSSSGTVGGVLTTTTSHSKSISWRHTNWLGKLIAKQLILLIVIVEDGRSKLDTERQVELWSVVPKALLSQVEVLKTLKSTWSRHHLLDRPPSSNEIRVHARGVFPPTTTGGFTSNLTSSPSVSAEYDEPLRIELLQLVTLLSKYLQGDLVHYQKEMIKFGWDHLKREDSASKQWAFVNTMTKQLTIANAPLAMVLSHTK
ncbi:putative transcription-associated protein 1 [Nymphaea thermarum]|nr:putative transcription-associated protein 1 [Nymphaea thermarum]